MVVFWAVVGVCRLQGAASLFFGIIHCWLQRKSRSAGCGHGDLLSQSGVRLGGGSHLPAGSASEESPWPGAPMAIVCLAQTRFCLGREQAWPTPASPSPFCTLHCHSQHVLSSATRPGDDPRSAEKQHHNSPLPSHDRVAAAMPLRREYSQPQLWTKQSERLV